MLALSLGIPPQIAWLVSPPVDPSVIGLLLGMRSLTQRGYPPERLRKPAWMLRLCAAITIALNTAGPAMRHQIGAALVDAILPILLMAWGEVGPWLLRELYTVTQVTSRPRHHTAQRRPLGGEVGGSVRMGEVRRRVVVCGRVVGRAGDGG